ncbi:MAG: hypothetical protein K5819_07660 [Lachnospiraceae bacterium]|nr:hypothetical protein [Lachnospiraceae bacterium]
MDGWRHTPVFFLTGSEDEESETKGLSLGAMDFICKPFVADLMLEMLKEQQEAVGNKKEGEFYEENRIM